MQHSTNDYIATINHGAAQLAFRKNAYGYFTVDRLLGTTQPLGQRPLFDLEKSASEVENLQAADPRCARFTDAVAVDGCVLTSFALHGESEEAVASALSKVWVVDGNRA